MTGWIPGMPLGNAMECWCSFTRSSPTCLYFEDTTGICARMSRDKKPCPSHGLERPPPEITCTCDSGVCALHHEGAWG